MDWSNGQLQAELFTFMVWKMSGLGDPGPSPRELSLHGSLSRSSTSLLSPVR